MERICFCGKRFKTYPSKVNIGRGKYCSKKCCLEKTSIRAGLGAKSLKGKKPWNYKGWRLCGRKNNYREIFVNGKYIREHRLVMENHLGRSLESWEEIDHIDGNGLNNDINNLQILSKSNHLKLEHRRGKYNDHLNLLHEQQRANKVHRLSAIPTKAT